MEEKVKKNKKNNFIKIIVVIVLFVTVFYLYIRNENSKNICVPLGNMSTQEIEPFNARWTSYEGTLYGTQVKALLTRAIANANTFEDVPEKILSVEFVEENSITNVSFGENKLEEYCTKLDGIYKKVQSKKQYVVYLKYSETTDLVNKLIIWPSNVNASENEDEQKERNDIELLNELGSETVDLKKEIIELKRENKDLKLNNNDLKVMLVLLSITVVILIIVLIKNRRKDGRKSEKE